MYNQEAVATVDRLAVTAVTAQELGAKLEPEIEVPKDLWDKAQSSMDAYKAFLVERTQRYVERLAANRRANSGNGVGQPRPAAGEITLPGYPYWDLVSISPIQFIGPPPWAPSKIVAAGEFALLLAVLFINPGIPPGGGPPGTVVLGGRSFRIRFEQINLTNVVNGPDFTFTGTFPGIAPAISLFPVFLVPPDPGVNPRLMEVNVTADITNFGQPFAAFATWHLDIDAEPPFLGIPPVAPELQHDIPLRYMIYRRF